MIMPPLYFRRPEKRRRALRGRNPTRDIRADGAPMVHQAPGGECRWGPFLFPPIGHRSYALENPAAKPHSHNDLRLRILQTDEPQLLSVEEETC